MKILITGAAGFIGAHLARHLLERGDQIIGIDNINDYYNIQLKMARLEWIKEKGEMQFYKEDICNKERIDQIFHLEKPDRVIHLAAQAGVRYSLINPTSYTESNIDGFINILEACRHHNIEHLVYASSSSVYGSNTKTPFSEGDNVDHPVSLYAATKKANELMAHSYSHLFRLPTTGIRFFTVYGPWGRPDMALFMFTKAILNGQPINIFNNGKMIRDFTFIDDIVKGVICILERPPISEVFSKSNGETPYRILNLGNGSPIELMTYVETLEAYLGRKAIKNFHPLQQGDVLVTSADTSALETLTGFIPSTSVNEGVGRFVDWYHSFYSRDGAGSIEKEEPTYPLS